MRKLKSSGAAYDLASLSAVALPYIYCGATQRPLSLVRAPSRINSTPSQRASTTNGQRFPWTAIVSHVIEDGPGQPSPEADLSFKDGSAAERILLREGEEDPSTAVLRTGREQPFAAHRCIKISANCYRDRRRSGIPAHVSPINFVCGVINSYVLRIYLRLSLISGSPYLEATGH